jgi:hypothetical protein
MSRRTKMTTRLTLDAHRLAQHTGDVAYDAATTPEEKYDAYRAAYDRIMVAQGVVRCPECYRILSGRRCAHCGGDEC